MDGVIFFIGEIYVDILVLLICGFQITRHKMSFQIHYIMWVSSIDKVSDG